VSVGDPAFVPLKTFLEKHAKTYHTQNIARTYGAFEQTKIIGYITLVCGEISVDGDNAIINEPDLEFHYKTFPAIKIARLLVDKDHRRTEVGATLVRLSLGIAKDKICPAVGCRFVTVDSKKQAVAFYTRVGFTLLDTPANKNRSEPVMFVDLHKAV
jgi:GNAT superfamily N-acetyltransferase